LWITAGVGTLVLAYYLLRIVLLTRSRVAMWYAASLGVVMFAGFYEVIAAALGVKELIGTLNHVTAALSSSLLAAFAIAERMRVERVERVRAETALKTTYDALPIGLFTLARDGSFERFNPALAAMLGIEPRAGERHYWRDHFEAGSWHWLRDRWLLRRGGELEISAPWPGGETRWFHVRMAPAGETIEGSLQDITSRHEATEKLKFLAENDPLTGVLNRRGIEKIIEDATQHAAEGKPLAVAYLDLDRFKLINDLFGHVAGDEVLRQVCRRIEAVLGEGNTLGRIGGDEFIIVFRDAAIYSAAAICRGIVEAIDATPFHAGDKAFQVKASIGLVEVADRLPVKDAIAVADRACRAAKAGGHDGLVVYDRGASVFREWAEERKLVERLGSGTAPEGLFLMMQPIMSLRAPYGSLNFEVLVRMREPDGTITPGGVIVATAENNGRASVIDRWVLANTLAWLDGHHAALAATHFVTMNLSGASLNDERFIQDAFAMLAGSPRAANRLCIEITEGVALHDLDNTRRFIDGVRRYGAKVALDDFGAGYTSFSYLRELPADALKIDGSLIVNVNAHPANLAIVEAIVELARNLGMKSIAEWAEDCATVESLAEVGVDYVQGFAIAHAQNPEAVLAAQSSASFITDEKVLRYVRDTLAATGPQAAHNPLRRRRPAEMH
ncbi:MAG: GGDEF and EAL domain-containing protein, partial [Betaproteobacteria bacterium]